MQSDQSENAERILKQAKNKYYLKREHLKENRLTLSSEPKKEAYLPPLQGSKKYTLVLDLDETLVHFVAKEKKFKLRPGCLQFLKDMSELFEVVIFTAAAQDYANFILDYLEKEQKFIDYRLYRQHC